MDHGCHDDGRHFLTEQDRKFIYGARNLTEGAKSNTRTRIRERLRCALDDISVLAGAWGVWNLNHFVQGMNPEQDDELYRGMVHTISLMYNMAELSSTNAERVFKEGIEEATMGVADVNVTINVDYPPKYDRSRILSKIENGEPPSPWEIGMLYYQGHTDFLEKEVEVWGETYKVDEFLRQQAPKRLSNVDSIGWFHESDT